MSVRSVSQAARREARHVDAATEAAYYRTIEEFFVERRGPPLFLSNPDWLLIRKWQKAGTPLRIVLRGIQEALDGHAHSWGRKRSVGSLQYCAPSVDKARERWHHALSLQGEQASEAGAFLLAYAEKLDAAALGPRSTAVARDVATQLRARAAEPAGKGLEDWLAEREAQLIGALAAEGADVEAQRAAVDAELAAYAERIPARVLKQIRESAVARQLLEAHGLDRLSLLQL